MAPKINTVTTSWWIKRLNRLMTYYLIPMRRKGMLLFIPTRTVTLLRKYLLYSTLHTRFVNMTSHWFNKVSSETPSNTYWYIVFFLNYLLRESWRVRCKVCRNHWIEISLVSTLFQRTDRRVMKDIRWNLKSYKSYDLKILLWMLMNCVQF